MYKLSNFIWKLIYAFGLWSLISIIVGILIAWTLKIGLIGFNIIWNLF